MNNRQNGRRRGRGGVRPPNGGGNMSNGGNRIDNRSRGNASQLYEKYKTLARDMQTQGDRVMTEYYLQFADHYFRVLAETRPRFEEQQRRQRDDQFDDFDDGDGDDGGDEIQAREEQPRDRPPRRDQPRDRDYNNGRDQRYEARDQRDPREYNNDRAESGDAEGYAPREAREERAPRDDRGDDRQQPGRRRRGRDQQYAERRPFDEAQGETPRMEADRLPPSLGRAVEGELDLPANGSASGTPEVNGAEPEPPAPRRPRRPRRPAAGGDEPTLAIEA